MEVDMIEKGTLVTVKTNNGGEITAPLALKYQPTYCATLDVNGRAVVILATRITSIRVAEIVGYPGDNGALHDWHGNAIGSWRTVATWRTPRSYVSSTMSQIEATVDGATYTGRGAGKGMIYRGKLKRRGRSA